MGGVLPQMFGCARHVANLFISQRRATTNIRVDESCADTRLP